MLDLLFASFFRYKIDDTNDFKGKTIRLVKEDDLNLHLIFGPDNVVYWVEFNKDELENQTSLSKMVRLGEICYCTRY